MSSTLVMVGTRKGLWIGRSDEARQDWSWSGTHFQMEDVYSVLIDKRGDAPRLLAGCSSSWFGPQLRRSSDLGQTWTETPNGAIRFPEDTGTALERIWQLQPGLEDGVIWAGTEPAAIFQSRDDGESFELVRSLWDHPHRPQWQGGYGGQAFHTILPHPSDGAAVLAAMSSGGAYRTEDGGDSWSTSNTGVKCDFMPGMEPVTYPEFGQCVHKIARDAVDPERLYLQNHGGVYRSDDGGRTWKDIAPGLPAEFGFAMVAHPTKADTAYCFPIADAGARWPVDGRARVYRTSDAGMSWDELGAGQLPNEYFAAVMRDAMCADDHDTPGLYFGGRNGTVFASPDEGETWAEIHSGLPDVMVVRAARI